VDERGIFGRRALVSTSPKRRTFGKRDGRKKSLHPRGSSGGMKERGRPALTNGADIA